MGPDELRREAAKAERELLRLERLGIPESLRKLAAVAEQSSAITARAEAIRSIATVPVVDLVDRRALLAAVNRFDVGESLRAAVEATQFRESLVASMPTLTETFELAEIAGQYRTEMIEAVNAATLTVFTASALESQLQLADVFRSVNAAPALLAWSVLGEEVKAWPARIGLNGILHVPDTAWVAESLRASAAWDVQAAKLTGVFAEASQLSGVSAWAASIRLAASAPISLVGLATQTGDVRALIDDVFAAVPVDWRDDAYDALQGLTPEPLDGSARSLAVRNIILLVVFLVLLTGVVVSGGIEVGATVAKEMLGTADLLIGQAVELGVALDDVPLVKAGTVWMAIGSAALWTGRRLRRDGDPPSA